MHANTIRETNKRTKVKMSGHALDHLEQIDMRWTEVNELKMTVLAGGPYLYANNAKWIWKLGKLGGERKPKI